MVLAVDEAAYDLAGYRLGGAVGHRGPGDVTVTGDEILRLDQRHLDRQRDHHLPAQDGVAHILIVREELDHIGRKLVRGGEAELYPAVLVGAQERLPRYRIGEILADDDLGSGVLPTFGRSRRIRNGLLRDFGSIHIHHHHVGCGGGVLCGHHHLTGSAGTA